MLHWTCQYCSGAIISVYSCVRECKRCCLILRVDVGNLSLIPQRVTLAMGKIVSGSNQIALTNGVNPPTHTLREALLRKIHVTE
jgi:hypothetical protein